MFFINVLTFQKRGKWRPVGGKAAVIGGQSDEEDEVEEGTIPRTWLARWYLLEFPLKGAVSMPCRCPSRIFCLCIDHRLISTFWLQEALMSTGYWALMHLVLPEELTSHYSSLPPGLTIQLPHGSREGFQVEVVHFMSRKF